MHAGEGGPEGPERPEAAAQLGEALFWLASLARRQGIDPEAALQAANEEFALRFAAVEAAARAGGCELRELSPEKRRDLWRQAATSSSGR